MIGFSEDLIVPYYDGLHTGVAFPLIRCYVQRGKTLCFVAAGHEVDPASETHRLIDEVIENFAPDAVVIEGLQTLKDPAWDLEIERYYFDQAVALLQEKPVRIGENSYTLVQAKRHGATILSGEPSEEAQLKNLVETGYQVSDFLFFDFLLSIDHWKLRQRADSEIVRMWQRHADRADRLIDHPPLRFSDFEDWFQNIVATPFTLDKMDGQFIAPDATAPFGTLRHIASMLSSYRDRHVLRTIQSALCQHDKVLVVYGGSHLFTLKAAIEDAMQEL